MNKTLILVTVLVVLGCSGAGPRQSSAGSQGPGTLCKSDNDCGFNLVCRPQGDGTGKCVPSNQPAYDPSAIGVVPTCHTDADCPAGYSCVRTGGQEGADNTLGNCQLPTGVTE